ncbi:MAG TPA: hypothetical protein VFI17_06760 [Solirubrobacterales bacterium]|nr:hypothetical protein [Solirubrobacterales bacterium]
MNKPSPDQTPVRLLHICPDCGSDLVQPTNWEQTASRGHWRIWRRCPECEWSCDGIHGEQEIDSFDEQLDLGTSELTQELRALEHANMAEMASAFSAALARDLIGPEDFA